MISANDDDGLWIRAKMDEVQSQTATTVTRGGQVVVIIPSIKTVEVGRPITQTHDEGSIHSTRVKETTLAKASASPETSDPAAQVTGPVVPTTFVTSVRAQDPVPPPVIIVTQVVTVTETPTDAFSGALSLTSTETSTVFVRPEETRPAGLPFPVGPLGTTEGQSPLETGGVHVPQEQFNGLAASPGVIAGSFAALVAVGLLLCFGCWVRRKYSERKLKQSGAHPGSAPPNPPRPPILPPINRYIHSPVWFGKKTKQMSTELRRLQAANATGGVVVASNPLTVSAPARAPAPAPTPAPVSAPLAPPAIKPMQSKPSSEGIMKSVSHTQFDLKSDILSTKGATADDLGYAGHNHHQNDEFDTTAAFDKENTTPGPSYDNGDIGVAFTQCELTQDQVQHSPKQIISAIDTQPIQTTVGTKAPGVGEFPGTNPFHPYNATQHPYNATQQHQYVAYPGGNQF
ncbi:hypothetical protein TWF718_005833 [Orbilia javanica]|uniref:Uncharacterized protein n=1 Tax=Orbilia javanica TaxID=47235 RepID=A0AAN8RP70_9PEZI